MSNPFKTDFNPDASFFEQARSLRTLRTVARALPQWCKANGLSVSLNLISTPEGVEINLGFPSGTPPEKANEVLKALSDTEKLMEMESAIQALTYFGGSPEIPMSDIINQLVEEADVFARQIHPDGEVLPGFEKMNEAQHVSSPSSDSSQKD